MDGYMMIVWLVILVVTLIAEIATVGVVSIWFCFGALVSMILSIFNVLVWVQIFVFFAVALLLLLFTRPLIKNLLKVKEHKTNADMVIGRIGVVTEPIDNVREIGAVKVLNKEWTARSYYGDMFAKDDLVEIVQIDGVKLIVKKPENPDGEETAESERQS